MKKYQNLVVSIGGGWRDDSGSDTLHETLDRAYLQAVSRNIRYVVISRRMKNGLRRVIAEVAAYENRVYMAKPGVLNSFKWRAELPEDPTSYVEITGRVSPELVYHI